MAAGKPRPWCSTCQRHYRGSWAIHAGTQTHRAKVARRESKSFDVGRKHAGRRTARTLLSRQDRADASMVKVDDYFRNPPSPPWPASIKDRVLYVDDHWRRPPGTLSGSSRVTPGPKRRRRRKVAKR